MKTLSVLLAFVRQSTDHPGFRSQSASNVEIIFFSVSLDNYEQTVDLLVIPHLKEGLYMEMWLLPGATRPNGPSPAL